MSDQNPTPHPSPFFRDLVTPKPSKAFAEQFSKLEERFKRLNAEMDIAIQKLDECARQTHLLDKLQKTTRKRMVELDCRLTTLELARDQDEDELND